MIPFPLENPSTPSGVLKRTQNADVLQDNLRLENPSTPSGVLKLYQCPDNPVVDHPNLLENPSTPSGVLKPPGDFIEPDLE